MIIDRRVLTAALTVFYEQLQASVEPKGANADQLSAVHSMLYEIALLKGHLACRSDKLSITDVKVLLPGEKLEDS